VARPKSTGVNPVFRRRKDKSIVKVDYYHRASRIFLGNDEAEAHAKAREIDGELPRAAPSIQMFEGLVADYLASRHFRNLAPSTQKLNRHYVSILERDFAGIRVEGISKAVLEAYAERLDRQIYDAPRERSGPKPRLLKGQEGHMTPNKAKHILNKLSVLLSHAERFKLVPVNPAINLRIGFGVKPRKDRWQGPEIRAFLNESKGSMRLAFALLLFTAQRLADILAMTWEQVEDREDGVSWATVRVEEVIAPRSRRLYATVEQQKTGEWVTFPIHRDLRTILHEVPVKDRHGLIVRSPGTKAAWAGRNFARTWDAVEKACGLGGSRLQRRDLRRTAMSMMSRAGATDQQVAAVSGHSIEQTRAILTTYIPRDGEIAAGGIAAWERMPSLLVETEEDERWRALHNPLQNSGIMQHAAE
jgi:integrase